MKEISIFECDGITIVVNVKNRVKYFKDLRIERVLRNGKNKLDE